MSAYDDEHNIGIKCPHCGMQLEQGLQRCVSSKGCTKRASNNRKQRKIEELQAEVKALKEQLRAANSLAESHLKAAYARVLERDDARTQLEELRVLCVQLGIRHKILEAIVSPRRVLADIETDRATTPLDPIIVHVVPKGGS